MQEFKCLYLEDDDDEREGACSCTVGEPGDIMDCAASGGTLQVEELLPHDLDCFERETTES